MDRGHSVVLRPWESRYQLLQPPVVHTVRAIRFWRLRLNEAVASLVGSTAPVASRRIVRIASRR